MTPRLELYWIPLGAGTVVVRISGAIYETLMALVQRRRRDGLYHSALVATAADGTRTTIEMAPVPDRRGREDRGVVAEGPVGLRMLRRLRIFRYEVRRWPGGEIPDLEHAVGEPVLVATDPGAIGRVLDVLPQVPTPVWGRDELRAGEMWNSNSVISWALARAGLLVEAGSPPPNGRAPGWEAGVRIAVTGESP